MKIAVCIKQVADTEARIKVKGDQQGVDLADVKLVMNPFDEYAVEEALKVKEKAGGEVVIVSVGAAKAVEAIRTGLAMGADRGIHIDSSDIPQIDTYSSAQELAKALKEESPDLILCGKRAVDDDAVQVPQMLAQMMELPHVTVVEKFDLGGDNASATVQRPVAGGDKEIIDVKFPAVLSCEKGLNEPRYASLPGIMKAKAKPMNTLKAEGGSVKTIHCDMAYPPERKAGKKIEGEPAQMAAKLADLLKNEAKVI